MRSSRREFLQTSALALAAAHSTSVVSDGRSAGISSDEHLNASEIARRHMIVRDEPGSSFFEGMLLGNGDVGACVVVRPDALAIHIGKNDCWDIRVSEDIADHVLPFSKVLQLWQRASEEAKRMGKPEMLYVETGVDFFRKYSQRVGSSYDGKKWPRPWPCGTIWINWYPTWVEPGQHTLDLATGMFNLTLQCTTFENKSTSVQLSVFVDWETGLVSASTNQVLPVRSIVYSPEVDGFHTGPFESGKSKNTSELLAPPETSAGIFPEFAEFSSFQHFPALGPTSDRPSSPPTDRDRNFSLCGRISGPWSVKPAEPSSDVHLEPKEAQRLRIDALVATPRDSFLRHLLQQQKPTRGGPDLVSIPQNHIYSAEDLDTKTFARHRVGELAKSELRDIRHNSESKWKEFWSHSAVEFSDRELERIWYENQYFLACCLRPKKVAPGLFANWSSGDIGTSWHGDYHADYNCEQVYWGVFSSNHVEQHLPFVELCENLLPIAKKFAVDQRLNQDSILDLALTKFLLNAVVEASVVLGVDEGERVSWKEISENLAPYPAARGSYGEVWVDVVNAPVGHIYNVPATLAPVFPGEQVGIGLNTQYWDIAKRTACTVSLEGGNDLVYQPMIRARLGMLDLEWFKKEVQYCRMPNGVANDRVRQSGGRYAQSLDFDYMMRMGFWCENFSLPAVLNECLMQSYAGCIRVFPNIHNLGPARFENLRAVGAFLVSATYDGNQVTHLSLYSEKGKTATLVSPWAGKELRVIRGGDHGHVQVAIAGDVASFDTQANETYLFQAGNSAKVDK